MGSAWLLGGPALFRRAKEVMQSRRLQQEGRVRSSEGRPRLLARLSQGRAQCTGFTRASTRGSERRSQSGERWLSRRGAQRHAKPRSVAAPSEYRPRPICCRASGSRIRGMPRAATYLAPERAPTRKPASQGRARRAPSNPSLERRPHKAWRLGAAQGSRRLHCPARPQGATPRGLPQLER
jgi:hypothetical protein